jgi:hypothetical protein
MKIHSQTKNETYMFEVYTIKDTDTFDIHRYPEVESEIVIISKHLNKLQANHKSEIVISFLKDHCIRTAWLKDNAEVAKMMTSGFLNTRQTESLFNTCKHNNRFLTGFEQYISSTLI